jgi:hypothetical protein
MRTDSLTGLPALTPAEVESLNPPGEPVEVVDWGRWPELHGYVVRTAELHPFGDPGTGEGVWWGGPVQKVAVTVRTPHGLFVIWQEDCEDLADLFGAEPGAPFVVRFLGPGEGFDVVVGQADDTPQAETKPETTTAGLLEAAQRELDLAAARRLSDEEAKRAALVASAEAILAGKARHIPI